MNLCWWLSSTGSPLIWERRGFAFCFHFHVFRTTAHQLFPKCIMSSFSRLVIYIYVLAEGEQLGSVNLFYCCGYHIKTNTPIQSGEREQSFRDQTKSSNAAINVSFLMAPTTKHGRGAATSAAQQSGQKCPSIHPLEQTVKHTGEMVKEFMNTCLFYF